jgi:ubiquinol-cytochrome c reductase cytochrome b/c1 subunit
LILGLIFGHLTYLHKELSTAPVVLDNSADNKKLEEFVVKDILIFLVLLTIFAFIVCFYPNYFGHTDNYIPANPLVTPPHIIPE